MAILSALFSLVSSKLGDLLQAIVGWSITGLFGQLSSKKRTALSAALVLSLAWPLLLVGIAAPRVTAWAIAFVPLHDLIGTTALRIVWLVLAIAAPFAVAIIARVVAPPEQKKGSVGGFLLATVPLTIGFCVSFLITLVVVPALRIGAMVRRWSDTHVFIQVRRGGYHKVLAAVRRAARSADAELEEKPVPRSMLIASRVLLWFARGSLAPIVESDPRMLVGDGLEIYLYPADLLLRGEPKKVARIRVALVTHMFRAPAHLVEGEAAQHVEDELLALWPSIEAATSDGDQAALRLCIRDLAKRIARTEMELSDWTMLHAHLDLLERALCGGPWLTQEPVERAATKRALDGHRSNGFTSPRGLETRA